MTFPLFPTEASDAAAQTDYLYWGLIMISAVVMLIVFVPIVFFIFKYRRGKRANRTPVNLPELPIELTWTILPTVIFVGLFLWGAKVFWNNQRIPPDAMEINVVGKQWMWKIQHPEGQREINELHVPVGRNIKITLASQDVIHSFFLPEFRVKQDVVPGRYTTLWFNARRVGTYRLFCSEYCGTHHSTMTGRVIVMPPAAYANWLVAGQPGPTLAQAGERLYRELGCSGCHDGSTVVRAPPLLNLFGKPVPLNSGEVVIADEPYLRDSILLPARQITGGYTNDMPSFQGRINEEQLLELIAYIRSRGTGDPEERTANP